MNKVVKTPTCDVDRFIMNREQGPLIVSCLCGIEQPIHLQESIIQHYTMIWQTETIQYCLEGDWPRAERMALERCFQEWTGTTRCPLLGIRFELMAESRVDAKHERAVQTKRNLQTVAFALSPRVPAPVPVTGLQIGNQNRGRVVVFHRSLRKYLEDGLHAVGHVLGLVHEHAGFSRCSIELDKRTLLSLGDLVPGKDTDAVGAFLDCPSSNWPRYDSQSIMQLWCSPEAFRSRNALPRIAHLSRRDRALARSLYPLPQDRLPRALASFFVFEERLCHYSGTAEEIARLRTIMHTFPKEERAPKAKTQPSQSFCCFCLCG